MQSQLHTSMACGLLLLLVLSHCTTLVASTQQEPEDVGCTFTLETLQQLQRYLDGDVEADAVHLKCVITQTAENVGSLAGGAAGAAVGVNAGSVVGSWVGGLFGAEELGSGVGSLVGGAASGILGYMFGGRAGRAIAETLLSDLLAGRSRRAALIECYTLLGLDPNATHGDVLKAYRAAARKAHPDKGGTHKDMLHVNVCKETVLDAHNKGKPRHTEL